MPHSLDSSSSTINSVAFRINGKQFTVYPGQSENSLANSVLVDFIRNEAALTGTKYMCREGGCGACVVTATVKNPVTGEVTTGAVNSCLIPVLSCDGWDISTVESLGNNKEGYDIIQKRLVGFSGTQCGYCSPGMVMNMHGLLRSKPNLTSKEIEDAFDGNICRCTGFRPIMDAFKSLATDATESIKAKCAEFEETTGKLCPLKNACCSAGKCLKTGNTNGDIEDCNKALSALSLGLANGQAWVKPNTLNEALDILTKYASQHLNYRIVAGNTSTGIYKDQGQFKAYIDVNGLNELKGYEIGSQTVTIGGGTSLSGAIDILKEIGDLQGFEYGADLAKHWQRVANTPVRNLGTIAGNLMIKHTHNEFPSDIFTTLEGIGAKINIVSGGNKLKSLSLLEFLKFNMNGALIQSVELPALPRSEGFTLRTFKITRRYQNAHAYVNAAILFKVDRDFIVKERPRVCFAGINPSFVHANSTETFFIGSSLKDSKVVDEGLKNLEKELDPDFKPPDASPDYRIALARNLLYKTILAILGSTVPEKIRSGGANLEHNLSSGKQTYDTRKEQWPLTKPIPKLEATIQCSGEAEYVNDIHQLPNELFGAFLLSKIGNADLKSIDASEALKLPGVVKFLTAKDIPGENNYLYLFPPVLQVPQEIFVEKQVRAAGRPLGLILAETRQAAFDALKLLQVTYENIKKPVVKVQDAVNQLKAEGKLEASLVFPAKSRMEPVGNPVHKIQGEFVMNGQAHFQMEPQVALVVPKEDSIYDVYSATQYMDMVQACVAGTLKIPNNHVNVNVRRLGGAFGSKATPPAHIAAVAALGAQLTNRPVRVALDIETNMRMIGKRAPYWCEYEVGFNEAGKIQSLNTKMIGDTGAFSNEPDLFLAVALLQNAYDVTGWQVAGGTVCTNTAPNTYCRAPGSTHGVAMIETIMDHIAQYLKKDWFEVRMANLIKDGGEIFELPGFGPSEPFRGENIIPKLVDQMNASASYNERKRAVEEFNKNNLWRKRGLSLVPMRYNQHIYAVALPSFVVVYHVDGSVAVSHGGIEMGQGLNTKAAQVVAYTLGIPLDKIKIKTTNNVVSANGFMTAGAIGSEMVAYSLEQACKSLLQRMAPVKAKLGPDVSWEKLVATCHADGMDLRATYLPSEKDGLKPYDIWALNLTEVEIDVLTGEYNILRLDIIEDAGKSLSPEVDIGQVEGSVVMGLGLWTLEKIQHDTETGELLTSNTWEYKAPLPRDIPDDFRVTLLHNPNSPVGFHGSKATGEPPLCTAIAVVLALKHAIYSAREDAGNFDHFHVETPVTPESILQYCLPKQQRLIL